MRSVIILVNLAVYVFINNSLEIRESVLNEWGLKGATFNFIHLDTSMFLHGDAEQAKTRRSSKWNPS